MATINTILIANRGEIAARILRTARDLGYRVVAVYSEADADARHVRDADAAVAIGPAPVSESYLAIEKIIAAAKSSGADAIHPGYGFLSENADFAAACAKSGMTFIGPDAEAIRLMGNKAAAKRRMIDAGVPCVPGYQGENQSDAGLIKAGTEIGFPLMVKAAAGGGGRGMRLVQTLDQLGDALHAARSEALNAFGSDELILEKAILLPRHVEIQVFADKHGHTIHMGERDCSVQRRHQKVIEEAPSPAITPELRRQMGEAAVAAAKSIGYVGAGTVEFLLDSSGNFYFLEMNTRLQVEHPVTEMITGLDLVALQIEVAAGSPLGLKQEDIHLQGHAIEVRLYAEDPAQDFLPVTGTIDLWQPPSGDGIRVDAGITSGQSISPFYDPMLAKIIAWGEHRDIARRRLRQALQNCLIFGSVTNRSFLIDCLEKPVFIEGRATTAFIESHFADGFRSNQYSEIKVAGLAAVIQYILERNQAFAASINVAPELLNWSNRGPLTSRYQFDLGDAPQMITVNPRSDTRYFVSIGEDTLTVETHNFTRHLADLTIEGQHFAVHHQMPEPGVLRLSIAGRDYHLKNLIAFPAGAAGQQAGSGRIAAPMHGSLLEILVKPGDKVDVGTRLAVLEAMKMQHDIVADVAGTVRETPISAGAQVAADDVLVEIEVVG